MKPEGKPFRFLDYYRVEDAGLFFGREKETRILVADILVSQLVVLFAPTGTGKTSLINAGVRARLEKEGYATFYVRVNQDPAQSARDELLRHPDLKHLEGNLFSEQLENIARQLDRPVVIFFDQFEEFFLFVHHRDQSKGREFIADIARIYHNAQSRVRLVFSMREEFFVEMDSFREDIPTIFHNECNLRLRGFDREQAREAIVYPLRAFEAWIEADLVERIITDLSQTGNPRLGESQIESAQLQIVCDTLWTRRKGDVITSADYEELGGGEPNIARQLLVGRFLESFDEISAPGQLELLGRLLPLLRTPQGTKYVRQIQDLAKELKTEELALRELLTRLEHAHFIRIEQRAGLELVELSHDYLVGQLENLRASVRTILPRRVLRTATEQFTSSGRLASREELSELASVVHELNLQHDQAEFLFRSSMVIDQPMTCFFHVAVSHGIDVWAIFQNLLDAASARETTNLFRYIGDLALQPDDKGQTVELPDKTFELTARALTDDEQTLAGQVFLADLVTAQACPSRNKAKATLLRFLGQSDASRPIASEALNALGTIETAESHSLVERALPREAAQDALVRLATARDPNIAGLARQTAIRFVRESLAQNKPPLSAIRILGEIESHESVMLLRQALSYPELSQTVRSILEKRLARSADGRVAVEARQTLANLLSSGSSTSILDSDHEGIEQPRALTGAPRSSGNAELDRISRPLAAGECVLFLGPGVHCPPPETSPYQYPSEQRPSSDLQLAEMLASQSGFLSTFPNEDPRNLRRVAQWYQIKRNRHELIQQIKNSLQDIRPSPLVKALAALPFTHIVTSCFDHSFEDALRYSGKNPFVRVYDPHARTPPTIGEINLNTPLLYKIFGDTAEPDSVVVTYEDTIRQILRMGDQESTNTLPIELRFSLHKWPTLFVGWSFSDYHKRLLWKMFQYKIDVASRPPCYSVDAYPDQLLLEEAQRHRDVEYVQSNTWTFVAELYKAVTGSEMPP